MRLLARALAELPSGAPVRPIDLDAAVAELDAVIRYIRTDRLFDGATDLTGERPVIELPYLPPAVSRSLLPWQQNERLSGLQPHAYDSRTRFTLAHELGHVLLHRLSSHTDLPARLDESSTERMCDAIAAELLMPEAWCREQLAGRADLEGIRRLALTARVSISAATVRSRTLGRNVVALTASRPASDAWGPPRWLGVSRNQAWELAGTALRVLDAAPCKQVLGADLSVRCGDHEHVVGGHVRTTYRSVFGVFNSIDGRPVDTRYAWRCSLDGGRGLMAAHRPRGGTGMFSTKVTPRKAGHDGGTTPGLVDVAP